MADARGLAADTTAGLARLIRRARHTAGVSQREAAHLRRRQFATVAVAWPAWLTARMILLAVCAGLAWRHFATPVILATLGVGVACSLPEGLVARELSRARPARWASEGLFLACIAGFAAAAAIAMAEMILPVGPEVRMLGTAVTGGLIGYMSWARSCLPRSTIVWIAVFASTLAAVLLTVGGTRYVPAVTLMAGDCLLAVAFVLQVSASFLGAQRLELQVVEQRETLDLLLRDFESGASDWLWEIDGDGRLLRVPPRLAELLGQPASRLTGRALAEILPFATPADAAQLTRQLASGAPFQHLAVDVVVAGELRHLRIGGRAIAAEDATAETTPVGWRGVGADITAEVRARGRLRRLAEYDSLTDLANRHRAMSEIRTRLTAVPRAPFALLLLDLDDFKSVNDRFGHRAGDELLLTVAHRLHGLAGPGDLVGRLGGDEFVMVLGAPGTVEHAAATYAEIRARVGAPCDILGRVIVPRISGGVAGSAESDVHEADDLLAHADLALHAVKRAGGGDALAYTPELGEQNLRRQELLEDLRGALSARQLHLVYQPQVEPRHDRVVGYEALLRWTHPVRGLVSPGDFIPLAEESGVIAEIGEWVLREACLSASALPQETTIAVNVSPRQLGDDLERVVAAALAESGLPGDRLVLEITESMLILGGEQARVQLQRIRDLGVRIALDDFGTGYSSLSHLRQLPLDELKIDRSFVVEATDHPGDDAMALVRAIVDMAEALGLTTTLEGIETTDQLQSFADLRVGTVQGFVYARPLPLADAARFTPSRPAALAA